MEPRLAMTVTGTGDDGREYTVHSYKKMLTRGREWVARLFLLLPLPPKDIDDGIATEAGGAAQPLDEPLPSDFVDDDDSAGSVHADLAGRTADKVDGTATIRAYLSTRTSTRWRSKANLTVQISSIFEVPIAYETPG